MGLKEYRAYKRECSVFKLILLFLTVFFVVNLYVTEVRADMGAKPSVTIHVENAPQDFYLALLYLDEKYGADKQSELKLDTVDEESVKAYLEDFEYDHWKFSKSPVGINIYEQQTDGEYYFGYSIPDRFRVILISKDGTVYLSEDLDPKEFNADVTYDVSAGTLTEHIEDRTLRHVLYVVACFILTLGFELLVLLIFRYPFTKRNIISFLVINLITNVPFNTLLINTRPSIPTILLWILAEIVIMLTESIFYLIVLRDADGKPCRGKSFAYGVVANLVSAVMGLVVLFVYAMIVGLYVS